MVMLAKIASSHPSRLPRRYSTRSTPQSRPAAQLGGGWMLVVGQPCLRQLPKGHYSQDAAIQQAPPAKQNQTPYSEGPLPARGTDIAACCVVLPESPWVEGVTPAYY